MFRSRRFHHLISHYLLSAISSNDFDEEFLETQNTRDFLRMTGKMLKRKPFDFLNKKLMLAELPKLRPKPHESELLRNNCTLLCKHMGLSDEAADFLLLLTVMSCNNEFAELITYSSLSQDPTSLVADTIGYSKADLVKASNELIGCDLFKKPFNASKSEFGGLFPLPDALVTCLSDRKYDSFDELASHILIKAPASTLGFESFEHLDLSVLVGLLKRNTAQSKAGLSILLYGPAGTGKTELARCVANQLSKPLYEVHPIGRSTYDETEEMDGTQSSAILRGQHFQLAQALCAEHSNSLIIVDECEDIFSDFRFGSRFSKMVTHSLLDSNPVPTIWITNDIEVFAESHLRRFTYVMELARPPKSVISNIIQSSGKGLNLSDAFIKGLATKKALTPATVANALDVSKRLKAKGKKAEEVVSHVLESLHNATGDYSATYKQAMPFTEKFINLKGSAQQLGQIRSGIEQLMDVRVLMTGPPGCGKTGYTHHLAETLDAELITAKCSDILSMYVGGSEQNVAQLFRQASESGAILFLDEVDSLLMSRNALDRSHEIQLVNEFLQQIEQFEYPLFAATNHAKSLDHAVARRFDFKLEFDYLNLQQVQRLFKEVVGNRVTPASVGSRLECLHHLTPGDFAILTRRNRYTDKPLTALEAVQLLEQENSRKQKPQSIGFIQ